MNQRIASTIARRRICILIGLALTGGCAGRPSLIPNGNPSLRKTSTEFAVDSAKRFPFKSDAPQGGKAEARVQVGYMLKQMDVVNLSSDTWTNVEIWINQQYVVFVPKLEPNKLEKINFQMFYDEAGHYFPKDKSTDKESLITSLNMYRDGKMYAIPMQLAD